MKLLVLALVLPLALRSAAAAEPDADPAALEAAKLEQLFADYFEELIDRNPIYATSLGDDRYNDRLPNFLAPEYRRSSERFERRWLAALEKIDRELLGGQDRLSYDVFAYERRRAIEGERFPGHLIPINQFFSLPNFFAQLGSGGSIQPFKSEKDYRDFLGRIDGFLVVMDQAAANMRQGIEAGVVQPRALMEKVLPQLEAHVVASAEESVFYRPIADLPEGIGDEARAELTAAYVTAIEERIVPAFARLHAFIRDEYLPACRGTVALSELPDGEAWYAYQVEGQTTTDLEPDEIYRFGLAEVARIQDEMRGVMREVGFAGDLADFFRHLEEEERFYYDDKEALLDGYRALQEKINALLPAMFDIFPQADYEVREVPEFMAESSAGAFYQPASPDGSRPGVFYVNTFNLKGQPKYGMETLSIHEASPGHHFQISIAQEIEELPAFRRFGGTTAFFEGWALYAESLGRDLGVFADPYQYYGRLSAELLRAMRLVVDTGLHAKGWSRERAIDYMLENSSMAESDVVAEVERYIAIPGQALAYKVGQRILLELRAEAEAALGEEFDLKAFHREVLIDGALPMQVLKTKIGEWIAAESRNLRPGGAVKAPS